MNCPKDVLSQYRPTPGTELHRLIVKFTGETPNDDCDCTSRAEQMDCNGIDWCWGHRAEIAGWMIEEGRKRGKWLAYMPLAQTGAKLLVRWACWKSLSRFLAHKPVSPIIKSTTYSLQQDRDKCCACEHFDEDEPGCGCLPPCLRTVVWLEFTECPLGLWK